MFLCFDSPKRGICYTFNFFNSCSMFFSIKVYSFSFYVHSLFLCWVCLDINIYFCCCNDLKFFMLLLIVSGLQECYILLYIVLWLAVLLNSLTVISCVSFSSWPPWFSRETIISSPNSNNFFLNFQYLFLLFFLVSFRNV